MPNYYAQIDQDSRVIGVSELAEEVKSDEMIPIEEDIYRSGNLLMMRYVDGAFEGMISQLTADKEYILADETDKLTILIVVKDWQNKILKDYAGEMLVEVGGMQRPVKVKKGQAEITLTSGEPGVFTVRTLNLDRNGELKVVVKDGE